MFDVTPNELGDWTSGITTRSTMNPPATIYIVTGDAGNKENHEVFSTAYRTDAYGYSHMTVHNASHVYIGSKYNVILVSILQSSVK